MLSRSSLVSPSEHEARALLTSSFPQYIEARRILLSPPVFSIIPMLVPPSSFLQSLILEIVDYLGVFKETHEREQSHDEEEGEPARRRRRRQILPVNISWWLRTMARARARACVCNGVSLREPDAREEGRQGWQMRGRSTTRSQRGTDGGKSVGACTLSAKAFFSAAAGPSSDDDGCCPFSPSLPASHLLLLLLVLHPRQEEEERRPPSQSRPFEPAPPLPSFVCAPAAAIALAAAAHAKAGEAAPPRFALD